jgi:hypothetical protein
MKVLVRVSAVLAFMAAASAPGTTSLSQPLPLDQPLTTTTHVIYGLPGDLGLPSDASEMGLLSRIAKVATVPFGFEADEAAPRPSAGAPVEPHYITAKTLREALDGFVALDPRYRWREVHGVFVVRTSRAWDDAGNVLNRRIREVHWHDLNIVAAFNRLAHLLYPNDSGEVFDARAANDVRLFSVDVSDGTILDVLNAAAVADGELGWWVEYGTTSSPTRFRLTIGHYGNGPTFGWHVLPVSSDRP